MSVDPSIPERAAVVRASNRAAAGYDAADVLAEKIGAQMLDRLDLVRLMPGLIIDAGCGTGHGALQIKRRYPKARVLAVDIAPGMLTMAARRNRWRRRYDPVCADAARLPVGDHRAGLVYSNMMLPACQDPDTVFREFARVLGDGGLLTFSTLGPDTLRELRDAWAGIDQHTHVQRFFDMHDIGDALVRCGLTEPVMDVDRYTLTYDVPGGLFRDLKSAGAGNTTLGRPRTLTGRRKMARVIERYERCRHEDRLPATIEVIYGQAWGTGIQRRPGGRKETIEIPLSRVGRRR